MLPLDKEDGLDRDDGVEYMVEALELNGSKPIKETGSIVDVVSHCCSEVRLRTYGLQGPGSENRVWLSIQP